MSRTSKGKENWFKNSDRVRGIRSKITVLLRVLDRFEKSKVQGIGFSSSFRSIPLSYPYVKDPVESITHN